MAVAQAVAVAPAEAVAQAAEEAQTVAEGTGGGGAHTARAPQQLVSPVTCAPVGGQHAAHCMAARPPPPRGAVGVWGGVVPRPSTSSCAWHVFEGPCQNVPAVFRWTAADKPVGKGSN